MMKFPLAFVLVAGVTLSGFAQQSSTYKVKRSTPEKPPKSTVPLPKTSNAGTSSAATSKELQSVEPRIRKGAVLSPEDSAASRTSFGGTAPENVKKATAEAKKKFEI